MFKKRAIDQATKAVIVRIIALTGPFSGFLAPAIMWALDGVVRWIVTIVIDYVDQGLFNVNMEIVAADQASDWRAAEAALLKAKQDPNLTDEYWEQLEHEANHKFEQLINLTK